MKYFAIFLLGIFVFCGVFYAGKVSTTSNTQQEKTISTSVIKNLTYTNPEMGYSIDYPSNLTIDYSKKESVIFTPISPDTSMRSSISYFRIEVSSIKDLLKTEMAKNGVVNLDTIRSERSNNKVLGKNTCKRFFRNRDFDGSKDVYSNEFIRCIYKGVPKQDKGMYSYYLIHNGKLFGFDFSFDEAFISGYDKNGKEVKIISDPMMYSPLGDLMIQSFKILK